MYIIVVYFLLTNTRERLGEPPLEPPLHRLNDRIRVSLGLSGDILTIRQEKYENKMRTNMKIKTTLNTLNTALRNQWVALRRTYEDTLYKVNLQRFFKGDYAIDELNPKVGVLHLVAIRTAILMKIIEDMPLACHLRRFRINSKK